MIVEFEEQFSEMAKEYDVPEHDVQGLWLYLQHGIPPGSFLQAVLENDLKEAFGRADHINSTHVKEIVTFLHNLFPASAWGSEEKVASWSFKKGFSGGLTSA